MLNGTRKGSYRDFVTRFDAAVHRYPERVAVIIGDQQVSYRQLYKLVSACVQQITEVSERYDAVLLGLPRSVSLIVAMIACQYCGTPYIPIDHRMPARRVRGIVSTAQSCVVLRDGRLGTFPGLRDLQADTPLIDVSASLLVEPGCAIAQEGREAYRILTSGTTGKPKLVQISTQGCGNLIDFFSDLLVKEEMLTVLSSTSPSFDIFYLEYALPLANGGVLILVTDEQAASPQRLAQILCKYRPCVYQSTPSLLKCLLPYLPASFRFDRLLVGGETLGQSLSAEIYARSAQAFNVYGPTETTVWSTCQRIDRPGERRIGLPIQNTSIVVVDEHGLEVPCGAHGRILIGGAALALGYLSNPALTEAKFVVDRTDEGTRYDTGDIGFVDDTGRLNFVARNGDFVKVNGYRVELAEIVDALEGLAFVMEAAVVHTCDPFGRSCLSAFVKLAPNYVCADPLLQANAHLEESFPIYMRPSFIEVVEDFPRSTAGKLDLARLTQTMVEQPSQRRPQTLNATEGAITTIAELLSPYIDVGRLHENDNLFTHGLTSIHAVSFHLELMRHWPGIELFQIFEHPTLSGLSRLAAARH
jgi:amino acid adenylation domain-containing protein